MGLLLGFVGLAAMAAGFFSVLYPLRFLRIRTRVHGALVLLGGFVLLIIGGSMMPSRPATDAPTPTSQAASTPAPAAAATPAPAPVSPTWTRIASWSGNGIKDTETFSTTKREWRIRWTTTNQRSGAGIFQIYVYTPDDELVNVAANAQGERSDTSYVRATPGPHYLKFNSANVDYTVTVEEQR